MNLDKLHNLVNETRTDIRCLEASLRSKIEFRDEIGILHTQMEWIQEGIAGIELEIKMHKKAYFDQLTQLLELAKDEL